ncbi:MAG: hypothetical protein AAF570_16070 [Bacteroidota bacterium]
MLDHVREAQADSHRLEASPDGLSLAPPAFQLKAGNLAAFPPAPLQMQVNAIPSDYRSYAEILALTAGELDAYARKQADWHAGPDLTDPQRSTIRNVLIVLRNHGLLGPFDEISVKEIAEEVNKIGIPDFVQKVSAFKNCFHGKPFYMTRPVFDLQTVFDTSRAIQRLINGFPDSILKNAMTDNGFSAIEMYIDEAIAYYQQAPRTPYFMASTGADFESYGESMTSGMNPLTYAQNSTLNPYIRNVHRFYQRTLDRLITNYSDTSGQKPLSIIIQSAVDDNGAFHFDWNLRSLVANNHNNTLLIEGEESLSAIGQTVKSLAKTHGQNEKIEQVMFSGHGNDTGIELGGVIKTDPNDKENVEVKPVDVEVKGLDQNAVYLHCPRI